jgi:hypothetical protein
MHVLNSLRTANLLIVDMSRGAASRSLTLGRDTKNAGSVGFVPPAQIGSVVFPVRFDSIGRYSA